MAPMNAKQRGFGATENALIKTFLHNHGYMKIGVILHLQGPYKLQWAVYNVVIYSFAVV